MVDDRRTPDHAGELELQRLSSEFLSQMEQVRSLEEQKRELPPGDERRPELAARIEAMTMELLGLSEYQSRLAAAQLTRSKRPSGRSITSSPTGGTRNVDSRWPMA